MNRISQYYDVHPTIDKYLAPFTKIVNEFIDSSISFLKELNKREATPWEAYNIIYPNEKISSIEFAQIAGSNYKNFKGRTLDSIQKAKIIHKDIINSKKKKLETIL